MAAMRLFFPRFSCLSVPWDHRSTLALVGFFLVAAISLPGCDTDSGADSVAGGGAGGDSAVPEPTESAPADPEFRSLPGDGVNAQVDAEGANERLDPGSANYITFEGFVDSTNDLRAAASGAGGNSSYRISSTMPTSAVPDGGAPFVDAGSQVDGGSQVDAGSDAGTP